jgi:hypothetical protein
MATSLALSSAPVSIFSSVQQTKQSMAEADSASTSRSTSWFSLSKKHGAEGDQQQNQQQQKAAPQLSDASWTTSGLTLQALYSLAQHINPAADQELTPVQAWFELAAIYPMELLLRADILDTLKKELDGVVKCVHYGATMERGAFESVVGRVLWPEMAAVAGE